MFREKGILFLSNNTGVQVKGLQISVSASEKTTSVVSRSYSWFQTLAVFWMLCDFFWVIPRGLNFICRRFGTPCPFHLHRPVGAPTCLRSWNRQGVPKRRHIKIQTPGNYPEESIQILFRYSFHHDVCNSHTNIHNFTKVM